MSRRRAVGEGSIYFDKDKDRWVGAIYVDGRRRKVVAATKTEARKRLDALRRGVAAGEQVGDGNLTVGAALERWQQRALAGSKAAPATKETYAWCCARLDDELGRKRLRTLRPEDVETAFDRMARGDDQHRPMGRAALVKVRSVLGQVLDWSMRRGYVARNVARVSELTPDAKETKPRRALDVDEARALLGALAEHRLGAMFTVMLTVGLRPGEAAGLRWSDVDLDTGRLAVRCGVRMEKGRPVLVDALKTARSRRTVDLPAITVDALRAHRKRQSEERLAASTWVDKSLVFTTSTGSVLDPANVRRQLRRLTESAGLGHLRPNELRHSAASILSHDGVPLEVIADLLGHTNTRMLEQTYRHALQPSIDAAVAPMDRALGG